MSFSSPDIVAVVSPAAVSPAEVSVAEVSPAVVSPAKVSVAEVSPAAVLPAEVSVLSSPKIISTGQGGLCVTNDELLAKKMRMIKNFGRRESGKAPQGNALVL